jgi:hypothetical protein
VFVALALRPALGLSAAVGLTISEAGDFGAKKAGAVQVAACRLRAV